MNQRFIGVENEFVSFNKKRKTQVPFQRYFNRIKADSDFSKSPTAIRTAEGLAFYVDVNEIELVTPPIPLNKGFATRLTDLLMIGRDRLVKSTPTLSHTGYSMHWNLTMPEYTRDYRSTYYSGIGVPFSLFSQTPLSCGINMRAKGSGQSRRSEFLGDSINNEDQLNATALLLGAYNQAINATKAVILRANGFESGMVYRQAKKRSAKVFATIGEPYSKKYYFSKEISAQEFLETLYSSIEPFVSELSTSAEKNNLEDFITGAKKLEIDKTDQYHEIEVKDFFSCGIYNPIHAIGNAFFRDTILLRSSEKSRELPLEGKLLGLIVSGHTAKKKDPKTLDIQHMEWDHLRINIPGAISRDINHVSDGSLNLFDIGGGSLQARAENSSAIYKLAQFYSKAIGSPVTYIGSADLSNIQQNESVFEKMAKKDAEEKDAKNARLFSSNGEQISPCMCADCLRARQDLQATYQYFSDGTIIRTGGGRIR